MIHENDNARNFQDLALKWSFRYCCQPQFQRVNVVDLCFATMKSARQCIVELFRPNRFRNNTRLHHCPNVLELTCMNHTTQSYILHKQLSLCCREWCNLHKNYNECILIDRHNNHAWFVLWCFGCNVGNF